MNIVNRLIVLAIALTAPPSLFAAEYDIAVLPPASGYELLRALQREDQSVKNNRAVQAMTDTVVAKGFVAGVVYALADGKIVCPPGMKFSSDIYLAVRAYLEQHASLLSGTSYSLTKQALVEAFPCSN